MLTFIPLARALDDMLSCFLARTHEEAFPRRAVQEGSKRCKPKLERNLPGVSAQALAW